MRNTIRHAIRAVAGCLAEGWRLAIGWPAPTPADRAHPPVPAQLQDDPAGLCYSCGKHVATVCVYGIDPEHGRPWLACLQCLLACHGSGIRVGHAGALRSLPHCVRPNCRDAVRAARILIEQRVADLVAQPGCTESQERGIIRLHQQLAMLDALLSGQSMAVPL